MKRTSVMLVVGMIAGISAMAAEPDLSKLPPPAKKEGVTFAKDIEPIFKAACTRCHSIFENHPRASGGLELNSLAAALKGGRDNNIVIKPGESAKSILVQAVAKISEHPMPPPPRGARGGGRGPGGAAPGGVAPAAGTNAPAATNAVAGAAAAAPAFPTALTTDEIALIRAWIDQGAK